MVLGVIEFKVALMCWFVEGLIILSIWYWFALAWVVSVYIFSCELIVSDHIPFDNYNFRFISQKKTKKKREKRNVMLKKERKIKSCCEKSKAKKKERNKRK